MPTVTATDFSVHGLYARLGRQVPRRPHRHRRPGLFTIAALWLVGGAA